MLEDLVQISRDAVFAVDLDHLDVVTGQIRGFAGFVADQLAALEARAKTVSGLWTGAAASASAYDQAHREWIEGAFTADTIPRSRQRI